ncbi:MAG: arsenic efflux protein [Kiritimatiellae bacterium]|nr:arsenic efflux protein [Kiritimatiellia bacterium]MBQ6142750.1 arsenic efflux protein [Kiritimatiellia bacterium]
MIEFIQETLLLFPFLFATYLVLEAVEAHAGGALGRFLGRSRSFGPVAGGLAGAIPQCGVSAAAASFFAGGVITTGTLLAVFLSTSDELLPVLISSRVPSSLMLKIVAVKVAAAIVVGFLADWIVVAFRSAPRRASVGELCAHSHCGCHGHRHGVVVPALIHAIEIFLFIAVVSGALEVYMHYRGEDALRSLCLNSRVAGAFAGGLLGLVPNCAVSVASANLYLHGAMSPSALMASSFTGSGLGLLVLLRTNRSLKENLLLLLTVYLIGTALGLATGPLIGAYAPT